MTAEQIRHARDLLTRPDNTVSSIAPLLGVSRELFTSTSPRSPAAQPPPRLPAGVGEQLHVLRGQFRGCVYRAGQILRSDAGCLLLRMPVPRDLRGRRRLAAHGRRDRPPVRDDEDAVSTPAHRRLVVLWRISVTVAPSSRLVPVTGAVRRGPGRGYQTGRGRRSY